jgi:hypothetical protein
MKPKRDVDETTIDFRKAPPRFRPGVTSEQIRRIELGCAHARIETAPIADD